MQIFAILSDYFGTLCSTNKVKDFSSNKIPAELDTTLSEISNDILLCVLSSKDLGFICAKITFSFMVNLVDMLSPFIFAQS
jgi:hypothetical protein